MQPKEQLNSQNPWNSLTMSELQVNQLESKLAFLERHIEEQDKVILKMRGKLDKILLDLESLKTSVQHASEQNTDAGVERPPHY